MSTRPPPELGRGVVVLPGGTAPEAWGDCPRVVVGDEALDDPGPVAGVLHRHWMAREPVVVELAADPGALRAPERHDGPVHGLTPSFEFARERLQFLVWANNYDARTGDPVWWHGRKAARLLSRDGVHVAGPADVCRADGTALFIDGGPPHPPPLASGTGVVHRWSAEAGSLRPAGHCAPASELAPDQLAAVVHRAGPARVIAPAGSGKTRVLTERLRHLVADRGVHPSALTALAYNNKAAAELRERCGGIEAAALNIRTLNSLGLWICNRFGPTGRLRVLEEPDVRDLLQRLIQIRRQANTDTVAPYIAALSSVRLSLADPEQVEAAIPDAAGIAEAFDAYRAALSAAGAVDFDEMIYLAIEILLRDSDARAATQTLCRHLLVDEFQDLNPAHLLLIRLVCAPGYDCFGVGDDDQVIYGYSGATPEYLINYERYFPGATGSGAAQYAYNAAGETTKTSRWVSSTWTAFTQTVDTAGEVSSQTTGTTTTNFTYDSIGARTTAVTGTVTTNYTSNQLGEMTSAGTTTDHSTYVYDGNGALAAVKPHGASTPSQFLWAGPSGTLTLLYSDGSDYFIYGPSTTPVEQYGVATPPPSPNPTFLNFGAKDGLSSMAVTNTSGKVVSLTLFGPYGQQLSATSPGSVFGYAGQFSDTTGASPSGFVDLRARWYSPTTANFTRPDPLVAQTHQPYAYANDDPLNEGDPTGKCGECLAAVPAQAATGALAGALATPSVAIALETIADVATATTFDLIAIAGFLGIFPFIVAPIVLLGALLYAAEFEKQVICTSQ